MKYLKKYYLLILLIISLIGVSVYGTYAMFTSSVETNMVNIDTSMTYKFKINGTQELKVSAGSKLRFNAVVENDMDGKISYGMYYKMISPSTLPSGVIIAQVSDDLTMLAKGQLEKGAQTTVPMVIKNTSDSEITVEIGVRTGYATDSQGVDDIIYNEGEIPITSFQTSEEAGNDSCTATVECTTDCSSKQVDGKWMEVCYCYTGNEGSPPPISGTELVEQIKSQVNPGTPDFSQTATTDEGIYSAQDNYGTSYYFRGAVTNNYVKFAGYYWRIIRINGDGTIRLIYDGTSAHANGEGSSDRQIGRSVYNNTDRDNAYVGYMYGQTGASSYNNTHANTNNSTIKTTVDNWYKTNIVDAGYSDKVADVIYCNDRSMKSGTGYGTTETYYGAYQRIEDGNNPVLTCTNQNDRFTVEDTSKGNGALTYPVGLITIDEVEMAGVNSATTSSNGKYYYLYTGNGYWTMSPSGLYRGYALGFYVQYTSRISYDSVDYTFGVRPVLSLKSDVTLMGSGTMNDPWTVQN